MTILKSPNEKKDELRVLINDQYFPSLDHSSLDDALFLSNLTLMSVENFQAFVDGLKDQSLKKVPVFDLYLKKIIAAYDSANTDHQRVLKAFVNSDQILTFSLAQTDDGDFILRLFSQMELGFKNGFINHLCHAHKFHQCFKN